MAGATFVIKNEDRRELRAEGDNLLRYVVKEIAKVRNTIGEGT